MYWVTMRPCGYALSDPPRAVNRPSSKDITVGNVFSAWAKLGGPKIAEYHMPEAMKLLTAVVPKVWVSLIWPSYSGCTLLALNAALIGSVPVAWTPWSVLKRMLALSRLLMFQSTRAVSSHSVFRLFCVLRNCWAQGVPHEVGLPLASTVSAPKPGRPPRACDAEPQPSRLSSVGVAATARLAPGA